MELRFVREESTNSKNSLRNSENNFIYTPEQSDKFEIKKKLENYDRMQINRYNHVYTRSMMNSQRAAKLENLQKINGS